MTVRAWIATDESTPMNLQALLSAELLAQIHDHFENELNWTRETTKERLTEILKFLFLSSCYPTHSTQKFFPLTKEVDEVWHYLIIQTREYHALCQALPGGAFIHHQSIPFSRYVQVHQKSRTEVIRDFLSWIPL